MTDFLYWGPAVICLYAVSKKNNLDKVIGHYVLQFHQGEENIKSWDLNSVIKHNSNPQHKQINVKNSGDTYLEIIYTSFQLTRQFGIYFQILVARSLPNLTG